MALASGLLLAWGSYALEPVHPRPAHPESRPWLRSCLDLLLSGGQKAGRKGVLLHGGSSLQFGTVPGVSLGNREMLLFHVKDLIETPDWFAWIRTLSRPLRRELKVVASLERLIAGLGSLEHLSYLAQSLDDSVGPYAPGEVLAVRIVNPYMGRGLLMIFHETFFGGENLYICLRILEFQEREPGGGDLSAPLPILFPGLPDSPEPDLLPSL